ncbi:MAG: hypothetical protein U0S50_18255 [Sphingopyxis sp.]|uniref:hypothetical protein n=1 Tax=Sphingopyxis sp. TaxID=1908224 RepID=UPI002ABB1DE3|nr:hypothetical protein [Sphingopyxis sp.]MDZ3833733.1 hypothetical protein [Sphingopyxis sp.]
MALVKGVMAVVGIAAIMMGALWMLQGLNIVRWPASSFMLGDMVWTRNGAILAILGAVLVMFARRR